MAKPAEKAFGDIIARHPSAVVTERSKSSLKADIGGGARALVATIGAMHYDDGGAWQPIDTTWQPSGGAWQYEMLNGPYQAGARDAFNVGEVLEYRARSGEWVRFQPLALNWRDENDSQEQIATPQAVATVATDDVLSWPNGYGPGRSFEWRAHPSRLQKLLTVNAASDLPTPAAYLTGAIDLELTFAFTYDATVTAFVDGVAWDRSTTVTTGSAIEFRNGAGETLWHFTTPRAWDSAAEPNETTGVMSFYRKGNTRHVSVRIPKAFVDAAVFPLFMDPTIDQALAGGANDADSSAYPGFDSTTETGIQPTAPNYQPRRTYHRWDGVTIPAGATIDTATVTWTSSVHESNTAGATCDVYAEAADNPSAPTSYTDAENRYAARTTASVVWPLDFAWTNNTPFDSPDIAAVVQEVVSRPGWASGNAFLLITSDDDSTVNRFIYISSVEDGYPANLYVEYTEGSTSTTYDGTGSSAATADESGTAEHIQPSTTYDGTGSSASAADETGSAQASQDAAGSEAARAAESGVAGLAAEAQGVAAATADEAGAGQLSARTQASDAATADETGSPESAVGATGSAGSTAAESGAGTVLALASGDSAATADETGTAERVTVGAYDATGSSASTADEAGTSTVLAEPQATSASDASQASQESVLALATGDSAATADEVGTGERVGPGEVDATGSSASVADETGAALATANPTGASATDADEVGDGVAAMGATGADAATADEVGTATTNPTATGASAATADESGTAERVAAGVQDATGSSASTADETGQAEYEAAAVGASAATADETGAGTALLEAEGASAATADETGSAIHVDNTESYDAYGSSAATAAQTGQGAVAFEPVGASAASAGDTASASAAQDGTSADAATTDESASATLHANAMGTDAATAASAATPTMAAGATGASAAVTSESGVGNPPIDTTPPRRVIDANGLDRITLARARDSPRIIRRY